jgi:hypothetical protein
VQRLVELLAAQDGQNPASNPRPGANASPAQSAVGPVFLLRQAGQQVAAAAVTRETVFIKSKSNDAADVLKEQAFREAISLGAATIASKVASNIPYVGVMSGVMNKVPLFGGAKTSGFELDYLRGLNAPIELKPDVLEAVIPAASAIPGAAGLVFEPLLLRLKPQDKDKVRIIAARKVQLTPAKGTTIGAQQQGGFDRAVSSVEYDAVAVTVQKNADGSAILRTNRALAAGEYALVLQSPEPNVFRLFDTIAAFRVR